MLFKVCPKGSKEVNITSVMFACLPKDTVELVGVINRVEVFMEMGFGTTLSDKYIR